MPKTILRTNPLPTGRRIDLRVPVFAQRKAECGNTSLKSVLWFLGQRISARHLRDLAGVTDDGVDHAPLVTAARRAGAAVFERSGGTMAELHWFLSQGLPPVIGWWSQDPGDAAFDPRWSLSERRARDCGHYSVVSGIDRRRILLMDPQWRMRGSQRRVVGRQWLRIEDLDRAWYDTDTPAFLRVDRWYMVVHDGNARFAPALGAGVDHPPLARVPGFRLDGPSPARDLRPSRSRSASPWALGTLP
jgi:hypothetical protein